MTAATFKTMIGTHRTTPPLWAVLERRLIDAIDEAAPIFLEKYTRPGGALIWQEEYPGDGVWADDLYEAFFNWPHYYALGGSEYTGTKATEQWNAITRQLTHDYGRVTNEFVNDDDWFHNAENYIYFYHLGMADPSNLETIRRARRFAGWYINEDPDVPNYDPQHRIVRSPCSGSRGPLFNMRQGEIHYDIEHGHATLGPGFALPGDWANDPEIRVQVEECFDRVVMNGDVTVNLGVVVLVATAYLHTGEAKYRDWIEEYVGAWIERTVANGRIVPDNVGPNGIVGEMREGQWWGGLYGWTGRFGHNMMIHSMTAAVEAAVLVTGKVEYLELLRMHLDCLVANGREEGGRLLVPYKHTDAGWGEYQPINSDGPIHLWCASMQEADWHQLETVRRGAEAEWAQLGQRGPRSLDCRAWTRFIAGECPDYPERILQANYREVCDRLDKVMRDEQDLTKLDVHWWQQVNPVVTEALVQLTTGAPQTIYWGGLAQGRVRYFDGIARRPGLPADVAALVTGLGARSVELTLVNLSPSRMRQVIVGAGSFGEHCFDSVRSGENSLDVDGTYFQVDLEPACQIELSVQMRRYSQQPSFRMPWHDDGIAYR